MCNYIYVSTAPIVTFLTDTYPAQKELSCQHYYHLVQSWCPKYIETERRCLPTIVSRQYWGNDICGEFSRNSITKKSGIDKHHGQLPAANSSNPANAQPPNERRRPSLVSGTESSRTCRIVEFADHQLTSHGTHPPMNT
ncbi:hypothetical protein QL093DRAFT_2090707 [Fusarium oxysporum]|nr:hypothetical protein QL093DRAFT_2090707 [Fusarium oxysporum]